MEEFIKFLDQIDTMTLAMVLVVIYVLWTVISEWIKYKNFHKRLDRAKLITEDMVEAKTKLEAELLKSNVTEEKAYKYLLVKYSFTALDKKVYNDSVKLINLPPEFRGDRDQPVVYRRDQPKLNLFQIEYDNLASLYSKAKQDFKVNVSACLIVGAVCLIFVALLTTYVIK